MFKIFIPVITRTVPLSRKWSWRLTWLGGLSLKSHCPLLTLKMPSNSPLVRMGGGKLKNAASHSLKWSTLMGDVWRPVFHSTWLVTWQHEQPASFAASHGLMADSNPFKFPMHQRVESEIPASFAFGPLLRLSLFFTMLILSLQSSHTPSLAAL